MSGLPTASVNDRSFLFRALRLLQTGAIAAIDPIFKHRHPGPLERSAIRAFGPLVRLLQPNDRWALPALVDAWLKTLDQPVVEPLPKSRRIFMFACYRGEFTSDLVMACLLAWRGHRITLGYLPKMQSPMKEPMDDHPSVGAYLDSVLATIETRSRGRIRCVDLSAYASEKPEVDGEFLEHQLHADLVMALARESFSEAEPEVRAFRDRFAAVGRFTHGIARAYLSKHSRAFDLCLFANGSTYENAQFCFVAQSLGMEVNCYEKFAFNLVRIINHGGEFPRFDDLDVMWRNRKALGFADEPLRSKIVATAWKFLNERKSSSGSNWGWKLQDGKKPISPEEGRKALGLDNGRKFALVCPNIPYDAGYRGLLTVFPSMREWLLSTVKQLSRQDRIATVVRAHPGEERPALGKEKIESVLRNGGIDLDRIIFLPGKHPVNTYALMPECEFGVTFSSTTGVEMAMHGKPVLPGTDIYYRRRGFTLDASGIDDYAQKLDSLIDGTHVMPASSADDAAMLYFMFHQLLQWPYPYDKPSHIAFNPPQKLVATSEISRYIHTLDAMSVPPSEWESAVHEYYGPSYIAARAGW